jgi:biotin-dependent carboxylase-like uncharacterized protein
MSLFVKNIFPGASIQDNGRPGLQRFGVTAGGAIDSFALEQCRSLFREKSNTAAIEFSGSGGKFIVGQTSYFSSTGAHSVVKLKGLKKAQGQIFKAMEGDEIEVSSISKGFYSYLHVAGGFLTCCHLGSRSGNVRAGLGTTLKNGDHLPYVSELNIKMSSVKFIDYMNTRQIRIIEGPQTHLFSKKLLDRFLDTEFEVSIARDRMGIRLKHTGSNFCHKDGLKILSEAIELGDIQIDGQGLPTVLLNDRQPTGGYPRIATVISADVHKVAQIGVNSKLHFTLVSLGEAIKALKDYEDMLSVMDKDVTFLNRDPRDISNLLSYGLVDGVIRGDEYDKS